MATETINHAGQIESIHKDLIDVMIESKSACASCHAQSACSSSDKSDKIVSVKNSPFYNDLKVGDRVLLEGNFSSGLKAVLYAYILPFVLVLVTLMILSSFTQNNLVSGLLSLGILVPYYTVVYALRNRFEKEFSFSIKKEA